MKLSDLLKKGGDTYYNSKLLGLLTNPFGTVLGLRRGEDVSKLLKEAQTGDNERLWLNILKDKTRPQRQLATGFGLGAGKASGQDVSNWLTQPGAQGIGDWSSFLLDEKERQALQDNPGKEAFNSAINLAGQGATKFLSPMGDALGQGNGWLANALIKGGFRLPGALGQSYGMTEEYKGEDPTSSMIGAGALIMGLPIISEAMKSLGGTGVRISSRSQGIPGQTTAEKAENLAISKKEKISGLTAQSRIDKAKPKVVELGTKKEEVLGKLGGDIARVKQVAINKINEAIEASGRADELRNSVGYKNLVSAFEKANTASELDNLVVKYENLAKYGGKSIDSATQEIYKKSAKSMVDALKDPKNYSKGSTAAAKAYNEIKTSLSNIYQTSLQPEILKQAAKENEGIRFLMVGGPEANAVPKGLFNLIGSLGGNAMQSLGKLGGATNSLSAPLKSEIGMQIGRMAGSDGGASDATQDIQQPETTLGQLESQGQMGGSSSFGGGMGTEGYQPIFLKYGQEQQAEQGQQFDMEKITMGLIQGVMSGQISSADAQSVLGMIQMMGGGSGAQTSEGEFTNLQDALDYVKQQYPSMPQGTQVSLARDLMKEAGGDGAGSGAANAQSALNSVGRLKELLQGGKGVPIGTLAPWGGLGDAGRSYELAASEAKDVLIRSRTGAALNMSEESFYDNYIPSVLDSEKLRNEKLNKLEGIYSALLVEAQGGSIDDIIRALGKQGSGSSMTDDYDSWSQ